MTTEALTIAELKAQVVIVAEARTRATKLKKQRDLLLDAWNKNNQELLDDLTQAGAGVAVEESKLRELTLQAYKETGSKKPVPGVGINITTTYEYDAAVALLWAKKHDLALSLDKAAFEKIAKADPPIFVIVDNNVPKATIATDLDKVLEEAK